jgi:hypothetical protein
MEKNSEKNFLEKVTKFSIATKLLIIGIMSVANWFKFDDHDFWRSASLEFGFDYSRSFMDKFGIFLLNFAKWDGIMFVKIFFESYDNLKLFAFFPGFPILLKAILTPIFYMGKMMDFEIFQNRQFQTIVLILAGCALNFVMHVSNTKKIYR